MAMITIFQVIIMTTLTLIFSRNESGVRILNSLGLQRMHSQRLVALVHRLEKSNPTNKDSDAYQSLIEVLDVQRSLNIFLSTGIDPQGQLPAFEPKQEMLEIYFGERVDKSLPLDASLKLFQTKIIALANDLVNPDSTASEAQRKLDFATVATLSDTVLADSDAAVSIFEKYLEDNRKVGVLLCQVLPAAVFLLLIVLTIFVLNPSVTYVAQKAKHEEQKMREKVCYNGV